MVFLVDIVCVFFMSSLSKLSFVSVVFVFNDSLNDLAPVPEIQLSCYQLNRRRCENVQRVMYYFGLYFLN